MARRIFGTATLMMLAAATAGALEFWPRHDGRVYRYRSNIDGVEQAAAFIDGGVLWRTWGDCSAGEFYVVTDSTVSLGDFLPGCARTGEPTPEVRSPQPTGFWPPIEFVRPGLAPGDSWMWTGVYGNWPCHTVLSVESESVSVPYGTFDTLKVTFLPILWGPAPYDAYWLHKELGPVKLGHLELVSIDGEVAVEPKTWSSVKSLYR